MTASAEEKRLLTRIMDLNDVASQQDKMGERAEAQKTRQQIRGIDLELQHVRGTDPGRAR